MQSMHSGNAATAALRGLSDSTSMTNSAFDDEAPNGASFSTSLLDFGRALCSAFFFADGCATVGRIMPEIPTHKTALPPERSGNAHPFLSRHLHRHQSAICPATEQSKLYQWRAYAPYRRRLLEKSHTLCSYPPKVPLLFDAAPFPPCAPCPKETPTRSLGYMTDARSRDHP